MAERLKAPILKANIFKLLVVKALNEL